MKKFKALLILSIFIFGSSAGAVNEEGIIPIQNNFHNEIKFKNINNVNKSTFKDDFVKIVNYLNMPEAKNTPAGIDANYQNYLNATNKFLQGNVSISYKEFHSLLNNVKNNDFLCIGLAYKFINMGFFSLASDSLSLINDEKIWQTQTNSIKTIYFPALNLNRDEELFLAELYTDIYFNNLSFEAIKELNKKDKMLKKSDYANYILSLAYLESSEYKQSLNAINKALSINSKNIKYIINKAKILCEIKDYKQAIKLIDSLLADSICATGNEQELTSLKEYILAKSSKNEFTSKYYLGNYFYLSADYARAIKTYNQCLNEKKKYYPAMVGIADAYLKTDNLPKAKENYEKALKINKKNAPALIGLGNISFSEKDYEKALEYYNNAVKYNKKNKEALLYTAMTYSILKQSKKAQDNCHKVIKLDPDFYETYYLLSKINENEAVDYLKKTTSMNPLYLDAWLDLAYISIQNDNIDLALTYLLPVKYIDNNNYRCYYYQGLIEKKQNNETAAIQNFEKALTINPNYEPARKEVQGSEI